MGRIRYPRLRCDAALCQHRMLNEQASGAPVLDKLGIHLNADDVARTIVQQIGQPKTHRAVSLQFALTYAASQLLPRAVTRADYPLPE